MTPEYCTAFNALAGAGQKMRSLMIFNRMNRTLYSMPFPSLKQTPCARFPVLLSKLKETHSLRRVKESENDNVYD